MTIEAPGAATVAALNPPPTDDRRAQITSAATQFEGLLIQQLVQVMRRSIGEGGMFGSGAGSSMYASMFDQNLATSMASAGGLGIRQVLERSMLGPQAYEQAQQQGMAIRPTTPFSPRTVGEVMEARPSSGVALVGQTGRLQDAARAMLGPNGFAPQWGRAGRLTEADLASDFSTEGPSGRAMFNVRDAAGFQDCYKCNLFAFELARRAGFQVPLIGRTRGWGYMGPDGVTADAARGQLRAGWGRIATGESAESLDSSIVRGDRAFLVVGSSVGDRAGHMGIVERVHEVEYDDQGRIERVVFDGWEGRTRGAHHMTRRTWNRAGTHGGEDVRGGFSQIELIQLRRPSDGEPEERPVHPNAAPSVHDLEGLENRSESRSFSSRSTADRPMGQLEAPE